MGTAERLMNVVQIIENTAKSHSVVAVVSAMSSVTKSEGTTSRLLKSGKLALLGEDCASVLEAIEETHMRAITETIQSSKIRSDIEVHIHQELHRLRSFLDAIHVIQEISERSQDVIVGTGERLSARVLSGILLDRGLHAVYTDLSEVVPSDFIHTGPAFYSRLQETIVEVLPKNESMVPVVTGYFGFVPGGIIAKVGRGYTDFTAAMIAGEWKADELQVWKEVDGIFTADPRKVPNAKVLEYISPEEAAELTYFGSEVLHPFTMERAIAASVPVRIKNTFAPEKAGTVVVPKERLPQFRFQRSPSRRAVAVTTKNDVSVLNIHSNRMLHSTGFLAQVFEAFHRQQVEIDLISTSEVNISCTITQKEQVPTLLPSLESLGRVTVIHNRAILSLVGENMKHMPGTASQMFSALAANEINIEMITQGASEINISCVIEQRDAHKALQVIHRTFLE